MVKSGLFGNATWLMCGAAPMLQCYAAPEFAAAPVRAGPFPYAVLTLRPEQWQLIFNSTVVSALCARWHGLCEANGWHFADDASHQLHRHVQAAQQYRFDADNLAIYAMTAMQLAPEAMHLDQARALMTAASNPGAVCGQRPR